MGFSIGEIFDQSWLVIRKNLGLSAGLTLVLFLIAGTVHFIPFIGSLILIPFQFGYLRCLWKMKNGEDFDYSDFFWGWGNLNRLGHVLLLQMLILVIGIFGCLLLLIPGIWFFVATAMAKTCLIFMSDDELDSIGAIKESIALTKGKWWKISGFLFLLGCLGILGFLFLGVGILISSPLISMMLLILTNHLKKSSMRYAVPNDGCGELDSLSP